MSAEIAISREQVMQQPGVSNARQIWAKRNTFISLSTRLAALATMANDRPATMRELLQAIGRAGGTPDELLALIADGTLQLNAHTPISENTLIRRRKVRTPSNYQAFDLATNPSVGDHRSANALK
jgi:hypothetical protein